jgi:hypothetical protein
MSNVGKIYGSVEYALNGKAIADTGCANKVLGVQTGTDKA